MSVEKFSVSFDPDLGRQIRECAEEEDMSVSAFLAEAARQRVRQLVLERWVDDAAHDLGSTRAELVDEGRAIIAEAETPVRATRRRRQPKVA